MRFSLSKRLALAAISAGWRLPESQLDRTQELSHLKRLLEHLSINCIFDVGANRGQFATEARGIGYRGRIVSFEPGAREFAHLERAFRHDHHWSGRQIALGRENGTATLNVIPNCAVMNSLLEPIGKWPVIKSELVKVQRLDQIAGELLAGIGEPRVFLKIDTQGFDLQVFEGARGCLDWIYGLQSELSVRPLYRAMPTYVDALRTYEGAGFKLQHLSVVSRSAGGLLQELNCMMSKELAIV